MAVKTIERAFPGKTADQLYGEAEKILRRLGEKHGFDCHFDPAARRIVVPEKLGLKGLCTIGDGTIRIELTHTLMGGALVGTVKRYIEEKLAAIAG